MPINQNYTRFRIASLGTSAILLLWYFLGIELSKFPSINFLPKTSENILAFLVVAVHIFFVSEVIFEWTKIDKGRLRQDVIQFYITILIAAATIVIIYPKITSSTFLNATNRYDLIIPILIGFILSPICVLFRDSIEISIVFWKFRKRIYYIHLIMIIIPLLVISIIIYINNYLTHKYELTVYIFRYIVLISTFIISYYFLTPKTKLFSSDNLTKLSLLSDSLDRGVEISSVKHSLPENIISSKRKHRKIMNVIRKNYAKYFSNIKMQFLVLEELKLYIKDGKLHINTYNNDKDIILVNYIDKQDETIFEKYYIKYKYIKSAITKINQTLIQTKITGDNYQSILNNIAYTALKLSKEDKPSNNMDLFYAVENGNLGQLKSVLQNNNIDINYQLDNGYTALTLAVANGDLNKSKLLLQKAADPNIPNKLGATPLGFTALYGNKQLCELLVSFGAQINYQDPLGFSPLMMAAQNGHCDIVKFLLDKGANILLKTSNDETALDFAERGKHGEIAKLLRKNLT